MAHAKPHYSKKEVSRAGDMLAARVPSTPHEIDWASEVLSNWRACHTYPINTFQATLRKKLLLLDREALVAQRLKRTPSIIAKLKRFEGMQLSRMQDIGGLRAVLASLSLVRKLENAYDRSKFQHKLVSKKDYILNPKDSGYRSIHLVYRYCKPSYPLYDGLQLEIQIRTKIQHAWATAVETAETFLNYALKSSQGPAEWLEFFSIAGSAFAFLEECPPVPQYSDLTKEQTFKEVLSVAKRLKVQTQLRAYTLAARALSERPKDSAYYLLTLNPTERRLSWTGYSKGNLDTATRAYHDAEARIRDGEAIQVVLVAATSLDALKKAYPNYFLDTHEFLKLLDTLKQK